MANVLNLDKQITIIGALAEGSSIRSIERITGVHRDTIMRLGVRVGQGCRVVCVMRPCIGPVSLRMAVTVLHIPPAISPETAVRAAIVQEYRNAQA